MGQPFIDRTGEKYGRLTILKYAGKNKQHYRLWKCLCECGNETVVAWRELSRGHTKSCGCLFRETISKQGGWNKKEYGESSLNQLFYNYKKSARERKYEFFISFDEFKKIISSDCYYCGRPPSLKIPTAKGTNGALMYNGVDRIDNLKGYIVGNIRPCCKQCNIAKAGYTETEFLNWVHLVSARFEFNR